MHSFLCLLCIAALAEFFLHAVAKEPDHTKIIFSNAAADGIDLGVLDFLPAALDEINVASEAAVMISNHSEPISASAETPKRSNIIDVHGHAIPRWYQKIVGPLTGGNPTPSWDISAQLAFMASEGIGHSVLGISTPGPNVFRGQKDVTVALARILNEQVAAYHRAFPDKFSFYAVVPLPYTAEAIKEATYAIHTLGASAIVIYSNIEGVYLGDPGFMPFFRSINSLGGKQLVFIHPSTPYLRINTEFVEANPTHLATGWVEFYFETARTVLDLTLSMTIHNFTNIHYIIPHAGGAFPSILDRSVKQLTTPAMYNSSLEIYESRFWFDSAGPTYYHQIAGLLGIGVPKSQLVFGSDFPYAPISFQAGSLDAVKTSPLFTTAEKEAVFNGNAHSLFDSKIPSLF